jgi:hypothetical protein
MSPFGNDVSRSERRHKTQLDQGKRCRFDNAVEVTGLLSNPAFGDKLRELTRSS